MNASTFENNPPDNRIPPLLLMCTCKHQRCHYNAKFKLDILCTKGLPYKSESLTNHNDNFNVQFIEFTYYNDKFSLETIAAKTKKYQVEPVIDDLIYNGWKVDPLMVIIVGARATTHILSMKSLEDKLNIPKNAIKHTFKDINTIVIRHAMSIIVHKRCIENNKPIPINPIRVQNENENIKSIRNHPYHTYTPEIMFFTKYATKNCVANSPLINVKLGISTCHKT